MFGKNSIMEEMSICKLDLSDLESYTVAEITKEMLAHGLAIKKNGRKAEHIERLKEFFKQVRVLIIF